MDADNVDANIASKLEWLNRYIADSAEWLLTTDRMIQVVVAIVSFLIAAYISGQVRKQVRLPKTTERRHPLRMYYYRLIRRITFPVALIALLGMAVSIYGLYDEPHLMLNKVVSLATAWLLIRIGSAFISNPLISPTISLFVWTVAALHILGYLGLVIEWLDGIKLDSSPDGLSIYDLITSSLSVAGFVWVAIVISDLINRSLQNKESLSLSGQALFSKISRFALLAIAFLLGLHTVGINLTAFAVFGGAIAVGIGLGLQKIFSNLIAGIILLSDKSIKPGDTIVSDGRYGKVNKLSARYISMITRDGTEHLIPNDDLINNRVENWSHSNENVRMKCPVGVHYRSDVHQAIALCIEAALATPRVLHTPNPACLLKGFGDNSVDLELRFWIRDPMQGCSNVKSEVMLKVWDKFHENGIELPYPQRDLHLRSMDKTVGVALARQMKGKSRPAPVSREKVRER